MPHLPVQVNLIAALSLLSGTPAQAGPPNAGPPNAGSRPAVAACGFDLPVKVGTSFYLVERALTGAGLSVGGAGTSERYGQNAHVTVILTCFPLSSGQTRVEVVAASTNSFTANFYSADLKARLQEKDPRQAPPGEAGPRPTGGNASAAQFGSFEPFPPRLRLSAADKALAAEGLTLTTITSGQHTAVNAQVAVVVIWAGVRPASSLSAPSSSLGISEKEGCFVVICLSTNSRTAEYYRDYMQNSLDPPLLPAGVR